MTKRATSEATQSEPGQPYPTPEELTRNRLLDAGIACLDRHGLKKTTMRLIAEESGIVRQTVYNYFQNKYDLLSAAFEREGLLLGEETARFIERFDSVDDKFVEGFLYIHDHFPRNPILANVLDPTQNFVARAGLSSVPFAVYGELVFKAVFEEHPYLKPHIEEISELWTRNVLSFLMLPGPRKKTRNELKQFVRRYLLPGIHLHEHTPH